MNITNILSKIVNAHNKLSEAPQMIAEVVKNDDIIYVFGRGHSHIIGLD